MTERKPTLLALPFALALVFSVLGCTPEVPANPTYEKDVQPILAAHCVRCHGANNMLNTNPDITSTVMPAPRICYLQRYGNEGDCTDLNNLTVCFHGAGFCGTLMGTQSLITERVFYPEGATGKMPPPPADPLNDWEKEVLKRWSTATPAER
jgi:hypothetical protein